MRNPNRSRRAIVLVHDLWLTPLSWEPFRRFYGNLGYAVFAPPWPGASGSPAALRRDPSTLSGLGVAEIAAGCAQLVRGLAEPPFLLGHGYGGLVVQLLLDQGLGSAGVALAPIPPKGTLFRALPTSVALLPSLTDLFNPRGTFLPTFDQFWRLCAHTLPESEARRAYEIQVVPAPCRAILQATFANLTRGAATAVQFKNPRRAPLLFIAGAEDAIVPPSVIGKVARKHRASPRFVAYREFPGRGHYLIAEPGWQEVADFALTWALAHADPRASEPFFESSRQPFPVSGD